MPPFEGPALPYRVIHVPPLTHAINDSARSFAMIAVREPLLAAVVSRTIWTDGDGDDDTA